MSPGVRCSPLCGSVPPCTLPTVACVRGRIWPMAPSSKRLQDSSPLCQLPCLATSILLLKAHAFCCKVEKKLQCCADLLRGVCTVAEEEEMEICRWAFPHLRQSTADNVKAWINMQSATSVWWLIQILARKKAFPFLALGKELIQKTIVKTSSSNHLILILPCQPVLWILQKVNTLFLTIDPTQYKTATPVCLKTYLFQNVRE